MLEQEVKIEGYHPSQILSLKNGKAILLQTDCMDAGGDWVASVTMLLKEGWSINEVAG